MGLDDRLKNLSVPETVEDISFQLSRLMPAGFPRGVPFEYLRQYPRYFRGINHRLERLGGNVGKDHESIRFVREWWRKYEDVKPIERIHLEKFRWMLEEYRISLFAQSIGTNMPVSEKRLAKEWESVMGKRS